MARDLKAKIGRKFQEWRKTQCVGCVGQWGRCELFTFAESNQIRPDEFDTIRRGQCPMRTNGTFFVYRDESGTSIKNLNDTCDAPRIVGEALATAISSFCKDAQKN